MSKKIYLFLLILLAGFVFYGCAETQGTVQGDLGGGVMGQGGSSNNACNASGAPAWKCVTPLEAGGGCNTGGVESVIMNDHQAKTIVAKVRTTMRPDAVGSKYPRTDAYTLKPGESKVVGCSRGTIGGRWLFYFDVTSSKFVDSGKGGDGMAGY